MLTVYTTRTFDRWLSRLKDVQAIRSINARIDRISYTGQFGDEKAVGQGVRELRIHIGPGYRLYFIQKGLEVIILLCGGDKSTQQADIRVAIDLAQGEFEHGGEAERF